MQKILIGALVLLLLFLAGMNAQLRGRQRDLEARLAAAERKTPRKTAEPAPPVAESVAARVDVPPTPPVAVKNPEPAAPVVKQTKELADKMSAWTVQGNGRWVFSTAGADLGLSDAQKKVIDELKRNRDAMSKSHQDLIDQIARDTDQAIRAVLTPEQIEKYDGPSLALAQVPAEPATGVKPGYLGISGDDSPGGGAKVTNVLDNTAAQASGLQPGDVILEFNGEPVDSLSALSVKIRGAGEGVATTLRIRRGQSEFQQGLQLGSYPK